MLSLRVAVGTQKTHTGCLVDGTALCQCVICFRGGGRRFYLGGPEAVLKIKGLQSRSVFVAVSVYVLYQVLGT